MQNQKGENLPKTPSFSSGRPGPLPFLGEPSPVSVSCGRLPRASASPGPRWWHLQRAGLPAMLCRATQDGWVMMESSNKTCSTGEGNGKPLQYSHLENPMNSKKRQNDRILKEELPRSVGAQHATGDPWRNNSRENEGMEPKQKQTQLWM